MKPILGTALLLLAALGCSRRVYNPMPALPPAPPSKTAVAIAMERHILNAIDAGDGDVRLTELRQRVARTPDDIDARLELARHYSSIGYPDVALEHYRMAAARLPDSAEIALLLMKMLRAHGLHAEARLHLEAYADRNPNQSSDIWSWLGILHDGFRAYEAAERSHRTALNLNPGSDILHNNLGYNLLLQGKKAEAAEEFRQALSIAPKSAFVHNNLGIALAEDSSQAVRALEAAADPATAHNNLAAILIEQGRYDDARRELQLALGYNKDLAVALRNLQLIAEYGDGSAGWIRLAESLWQKFFHGLRDAFTSTGQKTEAARAASN